MSRHLPIFVAATALVAGTSLAAQVAAPLPGTPVALPAAPVSARRARVAEDAYLAGARSLTDHDYTAAERHFLRAIELDPARSEYVLSLAVARQAEVTTLVQASTREHLAGHPGRAASLLQQARDLDPTNPIVLEHLPEPDASLRDRLEAAVGEPAGVRGTALAPPLAGPIALDVKPGLHEFHIGGGAENVLRQVYDAYGIKTIFDPSVPTQAARFDLDRVDFRTATRLALQLTKTFAVPLDAHTVIVYADTADNRDAHLPLIEETLYLPGQTAAALTDYGNLIRNVFNPRDATVSPAGESIVLRGSEDQLNSINAVLSDLVDSTADVLFDVNIYEIDKTHETNIGAQLPASAGVFSIAAEAQTLVTANQSTLNQAIQAGLLQLSGTPLQQLIQEVTFLFAAGLVNTAQFTGFLGTFGGGLSFAGLYLGSNSTFNLLLNSSDTRTLDAVQLRVGDRSDGTFRTGTRYPITTSTYSSGVSSALASQLAGVTVNGTSAASLLSQYLGTSSQTIPQIQYEDLGLTLKITPTVLKDSAVNCKIDLKIEALGGASLNSIPILNNRSFTSDVTVPVGQTALLASQVDSSELRSLNGLPFLSELPGFTGTAQDVQKNSAELLITITPHLVRRRNFEVASRRLLTAKDPNPQ